MSNLTEPPKKEQNAEFQASPRKSQATELVELCKDVTLFVTENDEEFAVVPREDHSETWPVRSKSFTKYLSLRFYQVHGRAPSAQRLQDAVSVLSGRAQHEGKRADVFTRLARVDDAIYLDLANKQWQLVEIHCDGWTVVTGGKTLFRRSRGMKPLPVPVRNDQQGLLRLRQLVNIESDDDWHLLLGWLLGTLNPDSPFTILALQGEQGSCKSTTASLIRSLIDPNIALLRGTPRNSDDLMIAAKNGWVLAFDNLSGIPPWLSDDLCRLATGGGLSKRELYTDGDEVIFSAKRPLILTGIDELLTRSDLADRAITLHLPVVPERKRRQEKQVLAEFEKIAPAVLGRLLDAVALSLKSMPAIKVENPPRMADFAHWVTAGEPALGLEPGTILAAYRRNQLLANSVMLDNSTIASMVLTLAESGWNGTASDLLSKLNSLRGSEYPRNWPANPKVLSDWLRRLSPNLRKAGVSVIWRQSAGNDSRKTITIEKSAQTFDASDASTQDEKAGSKGGVASVAEKSHSEGEPPFSFEDAPS